MPAIITKCKLLLGEGDEEVFFFNALLRHLGIDNIQVETYRGKDKLGGYLKAVSSQDTFRHVASLGVTRDQDSCDFDDIEKGICDALQRCGLPAPGTSEDGLQVEMFILPDNQNCGMLEDICLTAIQSYPEMSCIDEYFECVRDRAGRQPNNMSKARIHAWLASLEKPDLRLGEAAQHGDIPWDDPAFDELKGFLMAL